MRLLGFITLLLVMSCSVGFAQVSYTGGLYLLAGESAMAVEGEARTFFEDGEEQNHEKMSAAYIHELNHHVDFELEIMGGGISLGMNATYGANLFVTELFAGCGRADFDFTAGGHDYLSYKSDDPAWFGGFRVSVGHQLTKDHGIGAAMNLFYIAGDMNQVFDPFYGYEHADFVEHHHNTFALTELSLELFYKYSINNWGLFFGPVLQFKKLTIDVRRTVEDVVEEEYFSEAVDYEFELEDALSLGFGMEKRFMDDWFISVKGAVNDNISAILKCSYTF